MSFEQPPGPKPKRPRIVKVPSNQIIGDVSVADDDLGVYSYQERGYVETVFDDREKVALLRERLARVEVSRPNPKDFLGLKYQPKSHYYTAEDIARDELYVLEKKRQILEHNAEGKGLQGIERAKETYLITELLPAIIVDCVPKRRNT